MRPLQCSRLLRYFHTDIADRHVVVYSDCKALCHTFKSATSQNHDPLARAHLIEIGQWTRDIHHIEAKKNMMADYLSKKLKTSAADSDLEAEVKALEMVSLQTLSLKALADAQALCK